VVEAWTVDHFGVYLDLTGTFVDVPVTPKSWAALLIQFWQRHYDAHDVKRLPEAPASHREAGDAMQELRFWGTRAGGWEKYASALGPAAAEYFWAAQAKLARALTELRPYLTNTERAAEVVRDMGRGVKQAADAVLDTAITPVKELALPLALPLAAAAALLFGWKK
jgi:hypothetical protein